MSTDNKGRLKLAAREPMYGICRQLNYFRTIKHYTIRYDTIIEFNVLDCRLMTEKLTVHT